MSLLHRLVLILFASPCAIPCIAISTHDGVGPTAAPPTPQIFAPGVWSLARRTMIHLRFRQTAIRPSLPAVPPTGERLSSPTLSTVIGHDRRLLPSPVNGLTHPPQCRPMGPILYLNRTGRRSRWPLFPKEEK